MDTGLDALAVELYVTIDDLLEAHPEQGPPRPAGGFAVQIGDAELLTLAVMASMLQFTSERRWLRHANARLRHLFPYLPQQPGYNKRLRKLAATMAWLTGQLGARVSVADDDVWVADSTPSGPDHTMTDAVAGTRAEHDDAIAHDAIGSAFGCDRDPSDMRRMADASPTSMSVGT